jgi:predicted transcriptional regulator
VTDARLRDAILTAMTERPKWTMHELAQWTERPRHEVSEMIDHMMMSGDIRHEEGGYVLS